MAVSMWNHSLQAQMLPGHTQAAPPAALSPLQLSFLFQSSDLTSLPVLSTENGPGWQLSTQVLKEVTVTVGHSEGNHKVQLVA